MKRTALFLTLAFLACARNPNIDQAGKEIRKAGEIAGGFLDARGLAIASIDTYFVSHMDSDGKGVVSRIRKGKTEVLLSGLTDPAGLAVDPRRMLLFTADGKTVKVFKIKEPAKAPVVLAVPVQTRLRDVAFSIMNRRVYVTADGEDAIWEINPVKNTVKELLLPSVFGGLSAGHPFRIFPSPDGTRLYVTTDGPRWAALTDVDLRKKTATIVQRGWDTSAFNGIDLAKHHLVLSSPKGAHLRAARLPYFNAVGENAPEGLLTEPLALVMDYSQAVVLDRPADSRACRLVRIPIEFKY